MLPEAEAPIRARRHRPAPVRRARVSPAAEPNRVPQKVVQDSVAPIDLPTPDTGAAQSSEIPAKPRRHRENPRRKARGPINANPAPQPEKQFANAAQKPATQQRRFFKRGTLAAALLAVAAAIGVDYGTNNGDLIVNPTLKSVKENVVDPAAQRIRPALAQFENDVVAPILQETAKASFELALIAFQAADEHYGWSRETVTVENPEITAAIDAVKLPVLQKAVTAIRKHNEALWPDLLDETLQSADIATVLEIAKTWARLPQTARAESESVGSGLGMLLDKMDMRERLDPKYTTQSYVNHAGIFYRFLSEREAQEISTRRAQLMSDRIQEAEETGIVATCQFTSNARPSVNDCDIVLATLNKGQKVRVLATMPGATTVKPFSLVNPDEVSVPTAEAITNVVIPNGPWRRFGL